MLLTPNFLGCHETGKGWAKFGKFWPLGGAKNMGSLYLLNSYTYSSAKARGIWPPFITACSSSLIRSSRLWFNFCWFRFKNQNCDTLRCHDFSLFKQFRKKAFLTHGLHCERVHFKPSHPFLNLAKHSFCLNLIKLLQKTEKGNN